MPAGTPRGFNLQNFSMNGMAAIPGFGAPGQFPPFLAGHAVQAPAGWMASGDDRGVGPIRRGGGNFNNPRPGPYDRRPRDQRWGRDGGGRLSPPGAGLGGRMSGAGRWGDGAAGGAAIGPSEAVQGRSLKSYEDLDAVAGSGGGELNY